MFFRRRRCWSWIGACTVVSTTVVVVLGSSTSASAASSSSSSNYSSPSAVCSGTPDYIGDGECDDINNIEACGYDGGDCCSCTCTNTDGNNPCSGGEFNCLDPTAACLGEDDGGARPSDDLSSFSSSSSGQDATDDVADDGDDGELGDSWPSASPGAGLSSCSSAWTGDGFCDEINNTEECSYDAGDCCACTCLAGEYDCTSIFNCIDPAAPADCTQKDGVSPSPPSGGASTDVAASSGATSNGGGGDNDDEGAMSPCSESLVGNGACDGANNNAECGYDGGDCCLNPNCDLCTDPASSCPDSSSLGSPSPNKNKNAKIIAGVGVGSVGLCSVVFLALRYRHLALEQKASIAASSVHARPTEIAGPGDGSALPPPPR